MGIITGFMTLLLFIIMLDVTIKVLFFMSAIYLILTYVFESISIMSISKNLNYQKSFLAWIPIYNKYLLGKIIGTKGLSAVLTLFNIITIVTAIYCYFDFNYMAFSLLLIGIIVEFILEIIISHKIYKSVTNKYCDVLTIFNILTLGLLRPIILFLIRNKIQKLD